MKKTNNKIINAINKVFHDVIDMLIDCDDCPFDVYCLCVIEIESLKLKIKGYLLN